MRRLGMHHLADSLGDSVLGDLVEKYQLVDELWMLDFILENLDQGDPFFCCVAERHMVLDGMGQSPLHLEQWVVISQMYPEFGKLVSECSAARCEMSNLKEDMRRTTISRGC